MSERGERFFWAGGKYSEESSNVHLQRKPPLGITLYSRDKLHSYSKQQVSFPCIHPHCCSSFFVFPALYRLPVFFLRFSPLRLFGRLDGRLLQFPFHPCRCFFLSVYLYLGKTGAERISLIQREIQQFCVIWDEMKISHASYIDADIFIRGSAYQDV